MQDAPPGVTPPQEASESGHWIESVPGWDWLRENIDWDTFIGTNRIGNQTGGELRETVGQFVAGLQGDPTESSRAAVRRRELAQRRPGTPTAEGSHAQTLWDFLTDDTGARTEPNMWDTSQLRARGMGEEAISRWQQPQEVLGAMPDVSPKDVASIAKLISGGTKKAVARKGVSSATGPVNRRLLNPAPEIISYHGSPAPSFPPTPRNPLGEFDLGKIGTGEGSQMYAQGIYSSAERPIGESYRQTYAPYRPPRSGLTHPEGVTEWRQRHQGAEAQLTIPDQYGIYASQQPQTFSTNPVIDLDEVRQASMKAADNLNHSQGDVGAAVQFVEDKILREGIPAENIMEVAGRGGDLAPLTAYQRAMNPELGPQVGTSSKNYWGRREDDYVRDFKNLLETVIEPWKGLTHTNFHGERLGSLFEVGIKAAPEELIDLGKPLTGQSSQVQSAVRSIFDPLQETVAQAKYGTEKSYPSPLFADPGEALDTARTQLLRDRGVPGAQYLGHSSGKRNYVMWDTERMNILRKLFSGAGAVGAASQLPEAGGRR